MISQNIFKKIQIKRLKSKKNKNPGWTASRHWSIKSRLVTPENHLNFMIVEDPITLITTGEGLAIVKVKEEEMLYSLSFDDSTLPKVTLISRTSNEKVQDGPLSSAIFQCIRGLVRLQNDDMVFVADSNNIRVIYCLKSGK
jgi:hypothetical protein